MSVVVVPLLQVQRDLYRLPRGMQRFREYLRVMGGEGEVELHYPPLVLMNPMAKEHVAMLIDELLALDAEGIARRAPEGIEAEVKLGLVVVDDLAGGWTNRYAVEHGLIASSHVALKWGWASATLWSSEPAAEATVRETVRMAAHRVTWVARHGPPRTLREILVQEGAVRAAAGCTTPTLEPEDLEYTREVLEPLLGATEMRTQVECLFGDEAARTLGFTPRGLSPRAGLALALAEANRSSPGC